MRLFGGQFRFHNPELLQSARARKIVRSAWTALDWHYWLLAQETRTAYFSGALHPALWHGLEYLDPTGDIGIIEFCYNAPQWIFMRGPRAIERRLLVREALAELVPKEVRDNVFRGEQAADWHLQYNANREKWRQRLLRLPARSAGILWSCYDREAILGLFDKYPVIESPNSENVGEVGRILMSALCLAFFLEDVDGSAS
jgi:asparagine synthase (glutamine-hydrolysing)